MSPASTHRRRWHTWFVGIALFLSGLILIISDRVAAHSPGNRPWISYRSEPSNQPTQFTLAPTIGEPWPTSISQIIFPKIKFLYTNDGSDFEEIADWIETSAHIRLDINWKALSPFGIDRQSTLLFEGTDVPLPKLLDALLAGASAKSTNNPMLAWEPQAGRIIHISTPRDLAIERECRAQRQTAASPALRRELDRLIPYVKLRELKLTLALRHCEQVSGVTIIQNAAILEFPDQIDVIAHDVSFENLIELILHRTSGKSPGTYHFKIEGNALKVFRDGGEN